MNPLSLKSVDHRGASRQLCRPSLVPPGWCRLLLGLPMLAFTLVLVTVMNMVVWGLIQASVWAKAQKLSEPPPQILDGRALAGAICGVILPLAAAVGIFAFRRRLGRVAAGRILRLRLCPACGYSLAGLATEAEGCCVCAECGGAWTAEGMPEKDHP